jgi:hypothetical protein
MAEWYAIHGSKHYLDSARLLTYRPVSLEDAMSIQAKKLFTTGLVGFFVLAVFAAASAQTPEPIIGTWQLDTAKSSYKPGPAPKSATVVIEPAGTGIKVAIDAVNADGSPMKWGFTTQRDGKPSAVTGNPNYDSIIATKSSPTAGSNEYTKGGKPVATSKLAISADGKTMTVTTDGTDAKGQKMHNVAVYTKK